MAHHIVQYVVLLVDVPSPVDDIPAGTQAIVWAEEDTVDMDDMGILLNVHFADGREQLINRTLVQTL